MNLISADTHIADGDDVSNLDGVSLLFGNTRASEVIVDLDAEVRIVTKLAHEHDLGADAVDQSDFLKRDSEIAHACNRRTCDGHGAQ